jgi:sortase A
VLGKVLGGIGKVLIVSGLLVLGFVAYQLWGTGLETSRGQSQLTNELAQDVAATDRSGDGDAAPLDLTELSEELAEVETSTAPPMAPPPEGDPVGIITIPSIGVDHVMVEGVAKADLKKGPGHYPGTPLPGQAGNAGIAGHRTTYGAPFNRLDELVPGDEITVATPQGSFVYKVVPAPGQPADGEAPYIVKPSQVEVLEDFGDNRLTLTTCHPEYSARERLIVHAVLDTEPAKAEVVDVDTGAEPPPPPEVAADFDEGLEGDPDALRMVLLFGVAAAAVAALAWFLGRHTRRWAVYLVAAPGILVLVWFGYVYMDRYLPVL